MSPANRTAVPRGPRIRPSMLAVAIAASAASALILALRPAAAQSVVVSGGAVQSNSTPTTYDSLEVYGTDGVGNPSTYDADAALTLTGNLSVHDLGVLNANAAIVGQGWLYLARGGVINRSSAPITVQGFTIDDATLGILAGDTFTPPYPWWNSYVSNGGVVNVATGAVLPGLYVYGTNGSSAPSTLNIDGDVTINGDVSATSSGRVNLNAGTMDATGHSLSFSGVGSVNQNGGHYSATDLTLDQGATITYAPADSITGQVSISNGSAMTLGKDLAITGNLFIDGAASSLTKAGHTYSVASLNLTNGAALSYGAGDAIAQSISVSNNATLTLDQNLSLPGWLYLNNGGSISRTSQTIAAQGFTASNTTLDLLAGDSFTPPYPWWSSTVNNGAVVSAASGAVLPGVDVYGNATLDIDGDVTVNGNVNASSSGRVNLNAGTLDASGYAFSFSGVGSVNQNGGQFSVANLTLDQGATITYAPADSITGQVSISNGSAITLGKDLAITGNLFVDGATSSLTKAGHTYSVASLNLLNGAALSYGAGDAIAQNVSVSNNATLTLDQNLSLPGWLNLINGGSISRTSQTISAQGFTVINTTLDLLAGDSFTPPYPWWSSTVRDGAIVNAANGVVLPGVDVYGTNGSSAPATLNIDGDVTVNGNVYASSSGRVNLNAGTLDATGYSLSFSEVGSVNQSGGHYSATNLTLDQGAAITYGSADSITDAVAVYDGSAMTLGKDLSLAGNITVDGASATIDSAGHAISAYSLSVGNGGYVSLDQNLSLSGRLGLSNGGSISRSSETISALYFDVSNATLDLVAGDTFDPAYGSTITYGGVVNAPAGTALGSVQVYGVNGSSAPATFNVNGNTSVTGINAFSGGVVDLDAGTLTVGSLSLSGAGSILQHGGNYAATSVWLSNGAALAYGAGDSIGSLWINDAGSELDELSPLTLTSLSVSNGGLLHLASFSGTGTVSNWGLRWGGDHTSYLETLIAGNLLTGGSSPLSVFFDAGSGYTYVTPSASPVPEIDPASAGSVWALVVGALGLVERRKRTATGRA